MVHLNLMMQVFLIYSSQLIFTLVLPRKILSVAMILLWPLKKFFNLLAKMKPIWCYLAVICSMRINLLGVAFTSQLRSFAVTVWETDPSHFRSLEIPIVHSSLSPQLKPRCECVFQ